MPAPSAAAPAFDLARHPHFAEYTDPASGIKRYVLSEHVAPLQKAWYFVTPSIGTGGKWLWFHAVTPPSTQWVCAAASLDPDRPDIRLFPGALVNGNPMLVDDGSAMLAPIEDGVYRIDADGRCEEQFRIPKEFVNGRKLFRLVTELTRTCDGRHIILDSQIGNRTVVWVWDTVEKEARLLRSLDKKHMHTIASPTDPDLFLINQNPGFDPITGDKIDMDVRIWLMNISQTRFEPLQADLWWNHNAMPCHEWWTPEGHVQWCDYEDGIYECAAHGKDRPRTLVWPRKLIHGQIDPTGRWMTGDYHPYKWNEKTPCSVWVFDRQTGKEALVAHAMPRPTWVPDRDNRALHLDPHPCFSVNGDYLTHTCTDDGRLSVAVVPTAQFEDASFADVADD